MEHGGEHVPTHKPVEVCGNLLWALMEKPKPDLFWFPGSVLKATMVIVLV